MDFNWILVLNNVKMSFHSLAMTWKTVSLLYTQPAKARSVSPVHILILIVLVFNDTSTLVDHFVLTPREGEKRDRRDGREEREGQGRKRNRNESEETEEIKTFPLYLTC